MSFSQFMQLFNLHHMPVLEHAPHPKKLSRDCLQSVLTPVSRPRQSRTWFLFTVLPFLEISYQWNQTVVLGICSLYHWGNLKRGWRTCLRLRSWNRHKPRWNGSRTGLLIAMHLSNQKLDSRYTSNWERSHWFLIAPNTTLVLSGT